MTSAPELSPRTRVHNLERLRRERFDVVVIGGGITGAGVARDAALRGLRVALVERRDFAVGTSSRSSKLIHGGLRYLAQGDVPLVREAANERRALQRLAPHLARPIEMLVPVYTRRAYAGLKAALWTFDQLAHIDKTERNHMLGRDETVAIEPLLRPGRLYGSGLYHENLTDDARLVLETVKAAAAHGVVVVNHAPVVDLVVADSRVDGVVLADGPARLTVRSDTVVNAAGPWVDDIRVLQGAGEQPRLHLTKGIHLVVPRERLPVSRIVIMPTPDKRSAFVVPHGGVVYLGTTDTEYVGRLDDPTITAEDAVYLLAAANAAFAIEPLSLADVVGAWAGLRPLLHQEGKKPTEISRKDEIMIGPTGLISIAGGKLTTYRKMAERVVDLVVGHREAAGRARPVPVGDSALDALCGGDTGDDVDAFARDLQRQSGVGPEVVARLVGLYGSNATHILAAAARDPALTGPCVAGSVVQRAEVAYAVEHEMAQTLEDVLERRTRVFLWERDNGLAVAPAVAQQMAGLLGWETARVETEVAAYAAHVRDVKGFLLSPTAPEVAHG